MNRVNLLICCCLSVFLSNANVDNLHIWPNDKTIGLNTTFIIDGIAEKQNIVANLNKLYPAYLKSGADIIPLQVQSINTGDFRMTQAILKPSVELASGKNYELVIENLPQHSKPLSRLNPETNSYEKISWKATSNIDLNKPEWINKPSELGKSINYYGGGALAYVSFGYQANETAEYRIKTTIRHKVTNEKSTYYLKPDGESIHVGRGMTSGAFVFDDGAEYEVTFELLDAFGNFSAWTAQPIAFKAPSKMDWWHADEEANL